MYILKWNIFIIFLAQRFVWMASICIMCIFNTLGMRIKFMLYIHKQLQNTGSQNQHIQIAASHIICAQKIFSYAKSCICVNWRNFKFNQFFRLYLHSTLLLVYVKHTHFTDAYRPLKILPFTNINQFFWELLWMWSCLEFIVTCVLYLE